MTLHHPADEVAQRFLVQEVLFEFPARYNIGPMQDVVTVTENAFKDGKRVLEAMRWGLVPHWAKDASIGSKMFNARAETLLEKPHFKLSLERRRCLVVTDGFYEWVKKGKDSQPYYIHKQQGSLFAFAGLWSEWDSPDGSPLRTCTVITCEPNELMADIHNRMPVILKPEDELVWLNPHLPLAEAVELLKPYAGQDLETYPVDKRVGKIGFEDPISIQPLPSEAPEKVPPGDQLSLL